MEERNIKHVAFVNPTSETVLLVKENSLLYTSYLNRADLRREPSKDKLEEISEIPNQNLV